LKIISLNFKTHTKDSTVIHGKCKSNLYLLFKMKQASVQITLRPYHFIPAPKKRCFILCPVFEIKSSGISNLLYRMLQQLKMKILLTAKLIILKQTFTRSLATLNSPLKFNIHHIIAKLVSYTHHVYDKKY
jgi:hypothetical protein